MRRTIITLLPLVLLVSCFWSKYPSSFVGSWKAGEQGIFSTAIVMILKRDGTAEINAAFGIFKTERGVVRWKKDGDKLILQLPNGTNLELTILGKTDTTMTLRGPDGSMTTYTKIGDEQ